MVYYSTRSPQIYLHVVHPVLIAFACLQYYLMIHSVSLNTSHSYSYVIHHDLIHAQRLWKNVVKLPRSKQRERRYHNNRNQDLIFWILQINRHRHHHLCHLKKRRKHRLRIGLDIRKILDSVFIWVGGGMEMNEGGERCIDKIRRHSQCLCTRPPYNQWATKTTMKLLCMYPIYQYHIDFWLVKLWRENMKSATRLGLGLGREMEVWMCIIRHHITSCLIHTK